MSEMQKQIMHAFARVFPNLPPDKKNYLLGYAECLNTMWGKPSVAESDPATYTPNKPA